MSRQETDRPDYDIVWDGPSGTSRDAMPCGAGGVGVMAWCDENDLLIYLDRSGSFDENNQQLKLGRLRLTPPQSPASADQFRQRLVLASNHIEISLTHGDSKAEISVWVEVHRPVVHLDLHASEPQRWTVTFESWRTEPRPLDAGDRTACYSLAASDPALVPATTHPDMFEPDTTSLTWWHRNQGDDLLFDKMLLVQHLDSRADELINPQRDFTFGGRLQSQDLRSAGTTSGMHCGVAYTGWRFVSTKEASTQHVEVVLAAGRYDDTAAWRRALPSLSSATERSSAWEETNRWWRERWNRSHIIVQPGIGPEDALWRVGRNYQLFRAMLAANAGGDHPSKFNGSLFTVDPEQVGPNDRADRTPDFRAWGGASATAQNQRLLHFPMLRSGDFDLIEPQLEFYRRALPGAELRTRSAWHHDGASFTEQMENFGLPCLDVYDREWGTTYGVAPRPGEDVGELKNPWCKDLYDTVLEFCLLALDREDYGGAPVDSFLPVITSVLRFFDEHYRMRQQQRTGTPLGPDGRLVIFPGSACETYKEARDPAPTVAGLRVISERLLARADLKATDGDRELWARLAATTPELPRRVLDGITVLAPAASWSFIHNEELPQCYPIYPWGLYGVGLPELELARNTFSHGADNDKQHGIKGWKQDPIFAARLGLTGETARMIEQKLDDAPRRFPTFWGPNFDWTPDLNHGGSGAIALQEMLLQTPGQALHLFPAWPTAWDVDFKLHAPGQTIVEATLRQGKLTHLQVTPSERLEDIVLHGVNAPSGER